MKENVDYELITPQDDPHEQAWHIRILTGDFVETVLAYGNISLDGKNDCLRFNFVVVFSPDDELTPENMELQEVAAEILHEVLNEAAETGSLMTKDIS